MGTNVGHQQFWLTGSRVYFQSDPYDSNLDGTDEAYPIIDLGRVEPVNPAIETEIVQLEDADGGVKRVVAEEVVGIKESYEVRFSSLSPEMAAFLFSANPPTAFAQAATPLVAVVHYAHPGKLVKLRTAAGVLVYGVSAVTTVTGPSATPVYVLGTSWEVVSLERGLIRMIDGGVFAAEGNIEITYTPRSIPSSLRLISPQTRGSVRGTALFVWGRKNNRFQTVREAKVSLSPTGGQFTVDAFSSGTLRMTIMSDLTAAVPAGRLLYWLGTLPTTS